MSENNLQKRIHSAKSCVPITKFEDLYSSRIQRLLLLTVFLVCFPHRAFDRKESQLQVALAEIRFHMRILFCECIKQHLGQLNYSSALTNRPRSRPLGALDPCSDASARTQWCCMTLRKYNFATVCTWSKTKRDTRCQFQALAESQSQAQVQSPSESQFQRQPESRLEFSPRFSHKSHAAATTFWAWCI